MQTKAEVNLITHSIEFLNCYRSDTIPRILNIGAGRSVVIENQINLSKVKCIFDRTDIEDCKIEHPLVHTCYRFPIESMSSIVAGQYLLGLANFVMEHITDIEKAANEIYRILMPGGRFIATLPNPTALEMVISRHTPYWFHKLIRGSHGWETTYPYEDIPALITVFESVGFKSLEIQYFPYVEGYLGRFPVIKSGAHLYDRIVSSLAINKLMGHVCIILEKPK
jgi:SAM-dependent methyltransferase